MIFMIIALKLEADPLIKSYSLKRDTEISVFPVYCNENTKLIISGTGKIRAALAAAFLLSQCTKEQLMNVLLVNLGICGTTNNSDIGKLFSIQKVCDADSQKDYYPEIFPSNTVSTNNTNTSLNSHGNEQTDVCGREIICVSKPKSGAVNNSYPKNALFDMESSGIMEAAGKFLESQQVLLLKIPSDLLSPNTVTKAAIIEIIQNRLSEIELYIKNIYNQIQKTDSTFILSNDLDKLCKWFNFTVSMRHILEKDMRYCHAIGQDPQKILADFTLFKIKNKKEAKKIFDDLHAKLRYREI